MKVPLFIAALAAMSCCAEVPKEDRYLSLEEDHKIRDFCEPAGGCVFLPAVELHRLLMQLRKQGRAA